MPKEPSSTLEEHQNIKTEKQRDNFLNLMQDIINVNCTCYSSTETFHTKNF